MLRPLQKTHPAMASCAPGETQTPRGLQSERVALYGGHGLSQQSLRAALGVVPGGEKY